ncbi:hypothetical protein H072_9404 [Dactylellina haptotyla CBS 200.50]|uniref:Uncharacterized protein n=1 Tax=Dactylellina haptotyla (strain CBS 200.50) TaxID=1284197 RepID=S8A2R6_DACHA|nr:hypothetical protein H072_9404 [Dactylellina haptotyla CBS 200.50]
MSSIDEIKASPAFAAIQPLIPDDSTPGAPIQSVVESLTSPLTPTSTPSEISTYLQTLWTGFLLHVVDSTNLREDKHIPLSALLLAIQDTSAPKGIKYPDDSQQFIWSTLPDLSIYIRDWYNFSPSSAENTAPVKGIRWTTEEWIGFNGFLAVLSRETYKKYPPPLSAHTTTNTESQEIKSKRQAGDYFLYAIWALRELEVASEKIAQVHPADIAAAAMWLFEANEVIYQLCKDGKTYDGNVARGGEGYKDKGWKGFTVDRWSIWQNVLQSYATIVEENGEFGEAAEVAVYLAMQAVAAMERDS